MDLKQDENGDLKLTDGELTFVDGAAEVQQLLYQRLRTFYGEWFLNQTIGVPFFEEILVKNPSQAQAILRDEIMNTPGVQSIISFTLDVDPNTRKGVVTFEVMTDNGPIEGILPL
jgi:hypothetical protein